MPARNPSDAFRTLTRLQGMGHGVLPNRISRSLNWQNDLEHRPTCRSALDHDVPAMVLNDLLNNRQAESRAILFPVAHERLKKSLADLVCYSRTIIRNANFQMVVQLSNIKRYVARTRCDRFTGVQKQVMEHALELFCVEPRFIATVACNGDFNAVEFRPRAHRV